MQTVPIPRLMISAPSKSSGKTTVSLGLLRYFSSRGRHIRSYKKGPDYIDPMWHRLASGTECWNLDPWIMGDDLCFESFVRNGAKGDGALSLIEGNHGLHDGMSLDGSDSSAGLAGLLDAPVLLVVDSSTMNRGVAAMVLGMQMMPPGASIAGVILNKVRAPRQADKQQKAVEAFCRIPVLGAIPADKDLIVPERQLGLTTVDETEGADSFIEGAAERVARYCDMEAIESIFHRASHLAAGALSRHPAAREKRCVIGVFRDPAFCFYYPENLDALRQNGAELVFIDSLKQTTLPDVDGLYLGGGFPESFLGELSDNLGLISAVRERVRSGMPLYAECGGLIYLSRSASLEGKRYPLAGLLPFDIGFQSRPVGHGYLDLKSAVESPWFSNGERIRAHEFHYAKPVTSVEDLSCQFDVSRGHGITGARDGLFHRNLFASFAHLHAAAHPRWAVKFTDLAARYRSTVG